MQWQWLLSAVALVLIFEGLGPFAAPDAWRRAMLQLATLPTEAIRMFGGVLVSSGIILLLVVT
ncbi:MAG: DUF2065 domain-containing protein [Woeseiaceae bacterium]